MKMQQGFVEPDWIMGYDTETCLGQILTQQMVTRESEEIQWVDGEVVLENFLAFLSTMKGFGVCFCFYAPFDLAILLRLFITRFLNDDFRLEYRGWIIDVICSKNWQATFQKKGYVWRFLDIRNFTTGTGRNLEKMAEQYGVPMGKLERPENLGYERYTEKNRKFVKYALHDARLCYQIGKKIIEQCREYDIPLASSAANFAEKVFRRNFLKDGMLIQYSPPQATRLAELSYHGGKNGYYIGHPALITNCYEYDFNSAYSFAMSTLPSFLEGKWRQVFHFDTEHVGVYHLHGDIKPCRYGILYDPEFQYFRSNGKSFSNWETIHSYATSFEIAEALRCKELKIKSCNGWVWIPKTEESPLRNYVQYFFQKKKEAPKGTVDYIFYKLCLNSLYGKWIQRNPSSAMQIKEVKGKLIMFPPTEEAGGLYHPFIASLITGLTRSRLHRYEHEFEAIESSTDSVKSRRKVTDLSKGLGQMERQELHCDLCDKDMYSFTGLFVRNRLNLCMDTKKHVLKCALHGFWGSPTELYDLWKRRATDYTVSRMPLVREAIKQQGKSLFHKSEEQRSIKIDWSQFKVL